MSGEPLITVTGNLGTDAELKQLTKTNVTKFSLASTPRIYKNEEWIDGETLWFQVQVWGKLATSVISLTKGTKVLVTGRLIAESWEKDGTKRTNYIINADGIGLIPREGVELPAKPIERFDEEPLEDYPF